MDEGQNHPSTRYTATCADGGAPKDNQSARTHGFYARREDPDEDWTMDTLHG